MSPKAKAKVKAAAKAKGAAKAKAKARVRAMRILGVGLRRPARSKEEPRSRTADEKWKRGEEVGAGELYPLALEEGTMVAVTQGMYYLKECKIAGKVLGVDIRGGSVYAKMALSGTDNESLLKAHSGDPRMEFRVHLCNSQCNAQEVADTLVHARKMRRIDDMEKEAGWTTNLQKVLPAEEEDELKALRERGREAGLGVEVGGGAPGEQREGKKKEKKEAKKKKEKKKDKKAVTTGDRVSSSTTEEVREDGSMAKQAARKSLSALFRGTGLDPKEKIRSKVAKKARAAVKRKSRRDETTESSGSSGSSDQVGAEALEESVFQQASKVRVVASGYPGALASQTLAQMRSVLLSELGTDDKPGVLKPCALAYFRQHLARKASGPAQRELLSLATCIDLLLNGNPAASMDVMVQRFKSCESTLAGCHWSVAQKLELTPPENVMLTPIQEMGLARRDVYEETRLRWLSAQPDGRSTGGPSKGGSKSKTEGKETLKGGKDSRWGKGGKKGDASKKKEDTTGKA